MLRSGWVVVGRWIALSGAMVVGALLSALVGSPAALGATIEQAKLVAPGSDAAIEIGSGNFGNAVAVSGDGNTALVGAYADNGTIGAAWVFTRSGTTWSEQAKLTAP